MKETISKPEATATEANSGDDFEPERPKHGRGSRGGRMPKQRRGSRTGPQTLERPRECSLYYTFHIRIMFA